MSIPVQRVLLKRVLFRLHWIAGLTAGLVLAVVGFSGGLMGFEEPILRSLNPQFHVVANNRSALLPDRWIADARAAHPGEAVRGVTWAGVDEAVRLRMARDGGRGSEIAIDPYDGSVLGAARGAEFFAVVEQVHRTLAAGAVGKQMVGASTATLILIVATGLYLRWPRRRHSWSTWLRPNLERKGRGLLWQLHAVAGTWLLLFYLSAALTGLWWSYDFYRNAINAIAGVPASTRRPPAPAADQSALPVSVDPAWIAFRAAVPEATRATFAPPASSDAPLEIRYQTPSSPHERAWNTLKVDPVTGAISGRELYAELPRGRRFVSSLFPLHSGSFFGAPGRVLMACAALSMPLFALTGIWLWLLRRRNEASRNRLATAVPGELRGSDACAG
jgi:sulfite reductase (NADPH) flavoprotein alpha-component